MKFIKGENDLSIHVDHLWIVPYRTKAQHYTYLFIEKINMDPLKTE